MPKPNAFSERVQKKKALQRHERNKRNAFAEVHAEMQAEAEERKKKKRKAKKDD